MEEMAASRVSVCLSTLHLSAQVARTANWLRRE
jgi:hypothetical protein